MPPFLPDLLVLFAASLLAATIVPAQSEAMLAALLLGGHHHPATLVAVATAGNVLGACINWALGRYLLHFQHRRWFPLSAAALSRASHTYQRFGVWTLLLSWLPFVGDPLTLIAGALRTPFPVFIVLVTLGKLARYLAIMMIAI